MHDSAVCPPLSLSRGPMHPPTHSPTPSVDEPLPAVLHVHHLHRVPVALDGQQGHVQREARQQAVLLGAIVVERCRTCVRVCARFRKSGSACERGE